MEENKSNENQPQRVSALSVVLSAVELALSRGAYRMNEVKLISEAHTMLTQQEQTSNEQTSNEQTSNE